MISKENVKEDRIPDIAFVRASRVKSSNGYFYGAPDVAIEIKSPSQSKRALMSKCQLYLKYGAQQAWLVLPDAQQIEVYASNEEPAVYNIEDTIEGGDVMPGLRLALQDIFQSV
jgi:Uma2 family endonuclease